MPFMSFLDDDAGLLDIGQARAEKMSAMPVHVRNILRGDSELTHGEREFIGAFVSGLNSCPHCYGAHAAIASEFGFEEALIDRAVENLDESDVDAKFKSLLGFVSKLTKMPHAMAQSDADAVYAAGWSELALSDAILVSAYFNMANRIADGHGINRSPDRNRLRNDAIALFRKGYGAATSTDK